MIKNVTHADGSIHPRHLGGWKKQHPDVRDEAFRVKLPTSFLGTVPTSVDLRNLCSPVEDQGDLGSCTAHGFAACVEANETKRSLAAAAKLEAAQAAVTVAGITTATDGSITFTTKVVPTPTPAPTPTPTPTPTPVPPAKFVRASRLFEYYASRSLEGTTSEDAGATVRDAIKAGYTYGCLDETLWPYDVTKFAVNPATSLWTTAATHKVTSYHSITDGDLATMKSVLASGYLIDFGFQVYSYFMSQQMSTQGFLDVPKSGETLEGGHSVALVGYNDAMVNPFDAKNPGAFLVRNSWGTDWGLAGYWWMAYKYIANTTLCSDFWTIASEPLVPTS